MCFINKMPNHCMVPKCKNNSAEKQRDLIFHVLPQEADKLKRWLKAIGVEDMYEQINKQTRKSYRVCSDHFAASSYTIKKVLREDAIPFLHSKSSKEKKEKETDKVKIERKEISCQTTSYEEVATTSKRLSDTTLADLLAKPLREITLPSFEKRPKTAAPLVYKPSKPILSVKEEVFLTHCKHFIDEKLTEFVKCQIILKQKCKKNKFTFDFKLFSLNLFYNSPSGYRILQHLFSLPSTATLQKFYLPVSRGINGHFLEALKVKAEKMNASEKCCTVCVDTMPLTPSLYYDISNDRIHGLHKINQTQAAVPAKTAYVIMLQGLFTTWKQPVAYALISDVKYYTFSLGEWTETVIYLLIEIGFDVRAVVSRQEKDVCDLSLSKNISATKTSFKIANKKFYYIYDVPQLMNSARNNLMMSEFHFGDVEIAKWDHVLDVYNEEKKNLLKLARKFTEAHVNPNDSQKTQVIYSAQVFSMSLATAIATYVRLNQLDNSALSTVHLMIKLNDLFDLLNSNTIKNDNPFKQAYKGDELQLKYLNDTIGFLLSLRLVTMRGQNVNNPEFIKGFIVSINSIKDLWTDLNSEGFKYLLTRRLNLDCLTNLFDQVRLQSGKRKAPTCIQFTRAFKKIFVAHMVNKSNKISDDYFKKILEKVKNFAYMNVYTKKEKKNVTAAVAIGITDYRFNLPDTIAITYIAGYLIRKALEMHKCPRFLVYLNSAAGLHYTLDMYSVYYNNYNESNAKIAGGLIKPPRDFVLFVKRMEEIFRVTFVFDKLPSRVGAETMNSMSDLTTLPCKCFPLNYVKKLFIRLRIYQVVKYNNRNFKLSDDNRNCVKLNYL